MNTEAITVARDHVRVIVQHTEEPACQVPSWDELSWIDELELEATAREELTYAVAYLAGMQSAADLSPLELLDVLEPDPVKCKKCKKFTARQCATGDEGCFHCHNEECGHTWRARSKQ